MSIINSTVKLNGNDFELLLIIMIFELGTLFISIHIKNLHRGVLEYDFINRSVTFVYFARNKTIVYFRTNSNYNDV